MQERKDWAKLISQPVYSEMVTEKDVLIPMRDGVNLASDVYRPKADGRFPALLAFQPFGKNHEQMALRFPPQARPSHLWDGTLEGGDTRYVVSRGYVHVVVDTRGTGSSEGEYDSFMGAGGGHEGKDAYDVIEWIAEQPWCDGNVGMIGVSYLASMQVIAAAQQPPHLKAIFAEGGHYDAYELVSQGGIMWLMLRAAFEGLGGDSSLAVKNPKSFMMKTLTREEFERRIQERLLDPDVRNYPNFHHMLNYPESHPIWLDYILNPCDGDFYWGEGKPADKFSKVTIPAHFGVQFGRGWTVDGTITAYLGVKGPRRLVLRPYPPMQERPFHQFHDEIIRWYDHWLKGIDTGVMNEPPIKIFVHGVNQWRFEHEWPLPRTNWTQFFLRSRHRLLMEPETFDADGVPPDGFYQAPLTVTNSVASLRYTSPAFAEDTEVIGPCALYLHASIDSDDTNWIVTLFDLGPDGKKFSLTTGWLKASHREVDDERSAPWAPHHPHKRAVPVAPGEIVEYPIRIYPISNVFQRGHSLQLEIKSLEAPGDINPELPPESLHLNSARATCHKIYRDIDFQSYLLLPVIPRDS